jgi:hypothetical protein
MVLAIYGLRACCGPSRNPAATSQRKPAVHRYFPDMDIPVRVDEENSRAWTEVAIGSRIDHRVLSLVGDPVGHSNFAQVNDLYPFEKVSDRVRAYLAAALEHLMFWADYAAPLRFHEEQVTNFTLRPAYTLARAAIEASAQAVWLMDTRDPMECVRRHLCLIRWDLQEHRKSKLDLVDKRAVEERENDLLKRVSQVFKPEQIRPPGGGYLEVIRSACAANDLDLDAQDAERLWRAASGAAHGKYWPSVELQKVHPGEEYEPGHFRSVQLPDPSGMTEVLRAAHTMSQYGVLRFADYAGAGIQALLEEATKWVTMRLPVRADATPEELRKLRRD